MRGLRTTAAAAAALAALLASVTATSGRSAAVACAPRTATAAYSSYVQRAVASGHDVWGGELLRQRNGPSYAAAKRYLTPITHGMQWHGQTLTKTGSYYLPFSFLFTPYGASAYALHVADGSQIVTRHVGGPSLSVYVGLGSELYGSCAARLQQPKLAEGWLPILQTAYSDAAGVQYRQESFAGRVYGAYGARSVISFVRLTVDTRHADRGAIVRLVPWKLLAHTAPDRLALGGQTRLIVSGDPRFTQGVVRYLVPKGDRQVIYALWLNQPSDARYVQATEKTYDAARAAVVKFWESRLAQGATYSVPEEAVQDAEQGVLTQLVSYGWRYSIGNPYEELSYAESLDAAEVAAEYGYADVSKAIVDFSLARMKARPWRFTAFRGGHILSTAALYYRLTRDHDFLRKDTPALAALVQRIAARQVRTGPAKGRLVPEPLSTDLEDHYVDSVSGQIEAVEGLLAIGRVWSSAGDGADAARARDLAQSIDAALKPAVRKAEKHLKDGSLFVPDQLGGQKAFGSLTATRDGSYWNLVMPYAFASGWFPAHTPVSRGIIRYLLAHGSRLLGIPRTYARTVYGSDVPGAGIAPVYALSASRFFADNDQPDQLDLATYGLLAAGMSSTYVSGEAVSLLPVAGAYDRAMFMPPNSGANASYLETLRLLLIHERRGPLGAPAGLDLAFATPRAWLADGQRIEVAHAPTSFGRVSYTLERSGSEISGTVTLPANAHARLRLRLPAGERLARVVVGSTAVTPDAAGTVDLGDRHGTFAVRATVEG